LAFEVSVSFAPRENVADMFRVSLKAQRFSSWRRRALLVGWMTN
jgi:hypothetical protein